MSDPDDALESSEQTTPAADLAGPAAWVNWRAQRAGQPSRGAVEFAGYTDAQLLELDGDLGPCRLLNTLASAASRPSGGVPLGLVLRVEFHHIDTIPSGRPPERTDTAAWHGGDLDDELASLVALALGIRLRAGGRIREFRTDNPDMRGRPAGYDHAAPYLPPPRRGPLLPTITGPARLSDAAARLAGYPLLTAAQANALVKAARAWQEAAWIADSDPRQAWLRLVGAVEAAAQQWAGADRSPTEQLRLVRPSIAKRIERDATPDLLDWLAPKVAWLFGATTKFLDFTLTFLPDPPAIRPSSPAFQVDWARMQDHLNTIYDWRSRDLHEGTPIPAPMCAPPYPFEGVASERPMGISSWYGSGNWVAADTPMLLHTFAYVVRGALLNWLAHLTTTRTLDDAAPVDATAMDQTPSTPRAESNQEA
jgi:hypothetical protein